MRRKYTVGVLRLNMPFGTKLHGTFRSCKSGASSSGQIAQRDGWKINKGKRFNKDFFNY